MRLKQYKDKVYGVNFGFVFDVTDVKKVPEFLKKKDKKIHKWYLSSMDEEKETKEFAGRTIHNGNNILIILKKEDEHAFLVSVIVHELLHALFFVFGERGIEIQDGGTNEHATYYLDHLVYEALKK